MAWQDRLRSLGGTRPFQRVAPYLAGPVDRFVHRLTGGRWTVSEHIAPLLFLHHVGRRSGREHRTPLFYARYERGWVVVATNFGRKHHPAWSANLLAEPRARIEVSGEWHEVRARLASEEEWAAAWPQFVERWPGYETYLERASHRDVRMFVLEPVVAEREDHLARPH